MNTTKTKNKHIDDLHFEHQLWLSALRFYADELKIYQQRLEEVAFKNTRIEIRAQIEHFQNQFIIQKEQLDILSHQIKVHEQWLAQFAKENPATIDKELFADHKLMNDQIETFHKIYAELKREFKNFLEEWM